MHKSDAKLLMYIVISVFIIAAAILYFKRDQYFGGRTSSSIPEARLSPEQTERISVLSDHLDTPWSITELPDGTILASERNGTIQMLVEGNLRFTISDVVETSEGGLLGMDLHPNYDQNNWLYIYKTIGGTNIVERYELNDRQLLNQTEILTDIPAANVHNGGEIQFGPDGKLYITTGDATRDSEAQNRRSLAGKILRVNEDGSTPKDNPFGNEVWSYGHRNPQGLTWDNQDRLWSTEHGPSGANSGYDELNLITKGANYGWPEIYGDQTRKNMVNPVVQSGPDDTWAPAGLAYADGNLYFAGLRGETLYRAKLNGENVTLTRYLAGEYGRLRAVTTRNDHLLVSTSNRDGRGTPADDDDRILNIPLSLFSE